MPVLPGTTEDKKDPFSAPRSIADSVLSLPAEAPAAPSTNIYDRVMGVEDLGKSRLTLSRDTAQGMAPEVAARVLKLEMRTGLPSPFIAENLDEIEREASRADFSADGFRRDNPKLSTWIEANPHHYAFAKEDLGYFQRLERASSALSEGWQKADLQDELAGILYDEMNGKPVSPGKLQRRDELKRQMAELGYREERDSGEAFVARQAAYSVGQVKSALPDMATGAGGGALVGGAAGFLGLGAGAVPGAIAGASLGAAGGAAVHSYRVESAFAFDELREMQDVDGKPLDPEIAKTVAHGVGLVNAAIEGGADVLLARLIPGVKSAIQGLTKPAVKRAVQKALAQPAKRQILMGAAQKMASSGFIEGTEEFIQALVGAGGREAAQGISGQPFEPDSLGQDIEQAAQEGKAAAVGSAATFGLLAGGSEYFTKARQVRRAEQAKEFYLALDGVAETKSLKELPEKVQEAIGAIVKDGPVTTAYIGPEAWNTYWQGQNVDPRAVAAEVVGDGGKAYDEAVATGHDIAIPTERYARKIAPIEGARQFFADEIRRSPEELNAREAAELRGQLEKEAAQAEVNPNGNKEASDTPPVPDRAQEVTSQITHRLQAIGFDEKTSGAYAQAFEARYRARAEVLGADPLELFTKDSITIQREGLEAPSVPAYDPMDSALDRVRAGDIPSDRDARGASLIEFLREKGGIRPEGPGSDIAALEPDGERVPFRRNLIQDAGLPADEAAAIAAESGYLPSADTQELINALDAELRGTPRYSEQNADQNLVGQIETLMRVKSQLGALGVDLAKTDNAEAKRRLEANEGVREDIFLQDAPKGPRGGVGLSPEGAFIVLGKNSDLSTLHHEMGHLFLEQIRKDTSALTTSTTYQLLNDRQKKFLEDGTTVLKFLGVESWDQIGRDQHEKWARGYEAYLREGKAPSSALREVFAAFKSWMLAVYQTVTQLNVKLTPEIRAVYDRLLATEAEILEAQAELGEIAFPGEPEELVAAKMDALRAAEESLGAKLIAEEMRKKKRAWEEEWDQVRVRVAAEVSERPVYAALARLQASKLPEGVEPLKLSKDAIVRQYGESRLGKLPLPHVYRVKGGAHPDAVADLFGFSSGDELLHALETAPPMDEEINRITDERMRLKHGDLMTDGRLPEAAMEALHNDKRALLLRKRLQFLATKRIGQLKEGVRRAARPLPTDKAVRAQAFEIISEKKVREVSPHLYKRAESKAEREALDLFLAGDFEASYQAQLRALLNHELYRAAVEARDDVRKIREYAREISRPKRRAAIGKAGQEWLDQVDGLLTRYSFRSQPPDQIPDLREFIDMVVKTTGEEIAASPDALNASRVVHFQNASIGELRGVFDTLTSLEHVARRVNEVRTAGEKLEREQAIQLMVARVHESLPNEKPLPETEAEYSNAEKVWKASKGFLDTTLRPEKIIERLDGGTSGIFHDLLWNPAAAAQVKRDELLDQVMKPLLKLAEDLPKARLERLDHKLFIPSLGQSLTRRTLIGVALNLGNESNRTKLMRGGMWFGEEHVELSQAAIDEMLGHLDAGDVQMVNTIWSTVDLLFPELDALNRRAVGLPLERIEGVPLAIPAGELKGGYWPLVGDPRHSRTGERQVEADMKLGDLFPPKYAKAATRHSFRKSRTDAVYAIQLDWAHVLGKHIQAEVTDIAYYEYVSQARRLLESTPVKKAIQNRMGEHVRVMLDEWLVHQVNPPLHGYRGNDPLKIIWDRLVSNTAIAAIGLNVGVAVKNVVTAPLQGWSQTDALSMLKAVPSFIINPEKAYDAIAAVSGEMKHRPKNIDKTFSDLRKELEGKRSLRAKAASLSMEIHSLADKYVTTLLWMAKYQQEIDGGKTEQESILLADKMIRTTQTAGAPKDLSSFERDPNHRWAKLFIGPLLVQLNEGRSAVAGKSLSQVMTSPSVWRKSVAVWVTAALIWPLLSGRGPGEDEDPYEWAAIQLAFGPLTMIPFVREGADVLLAKIQGERVFVRSHPIAEAIVMGGEAIDALLDEDAETGTKIEKTLRASGPLIGLPTNQAIKAGRLINEAQAD